MPPIDPSGPGPPHGETPIRVAPQFSRLLRLFVTDHAFITIPGVVALVIWSLCAGTLTLDYAGILDTYKFPVLEKWLSYDTALAVLGTIAAAAITTLSLVYSLVLVVFTLAAGTIAPRLLQRFTKERVSQLTAGLLGGTFLFALTVLSTTAPDFIPRLSAAAAFFLAALSMLQLIYFVHAVSVSVTIDQEIASISSDLKSKVAGIIKTDEEAGKALDPWPEDFEFDIKANSSGFLSLPNVDDLVAYAAREDLMIELCAMHGDFVTEGAPIARIASRTEEACGERQSDIASAVCSRVKMARIRDDYRDVVFSLNLLLEIALRALSPGVNDTFTAISCANRISEVLSDPVARGIRENLHLDADDHPRLRIPGLTLEHLLSRALDPLRQAAADNHLMLTCLAEVLRRLAAVAQNSRSSYLLTEHAQKMLASYKKSDPIGEDLRDLEAHLAPLLGKASAG
ncbi:DUF2254 domain-containing protein [Roseibium sp.]|uniref:DUF2254 domain-containing protein n=1 Tax=Roseibium sp. TaxID=1936156 RepID=UPI003A969FB4